MTNVPPSKKAGCWIASTYPGWGKNPYLETSAAGGLSGRSPTTAGRATGP